MLYKKDDFTLTVYVLCSKDLSYLLYEQLLRNYTRKIINSLLLKVSSEVIQYLYNKSDCKSGFEQFGKQDRCDMWNSIGKTSKRVKMQIGRDSAFKVKIYVVTS